MALTKAERRLAAIVAADVVGYSRLMTRDEAGTLEALKSHRARLIDPVIAAHHGRLVKTTGDGLLLEFPSDTEALWSYGDVLTLSGDAETAMPLMEEAARFRPTRPVAEYLGLGIAYLLVARPADAARVIEQGASHAGSRGWSSVLLTIAYSELGRTAEAESEAANVCRIMPEFKADTFGSLLRYPKGRAFMRDALQRAKL